MGKLTPECWPLRLPVEVATFQVELKPFGLFHSAIRVLPVSHKACHYPAITCAMDGREGKLKYLSELCFVFSSIEHCLKSLTKKIGSFFWIQFQLQIEHLQNPRFCGFFIL